MHDGIVFISIIIAVIIWGILGASDHYSCVGISQHCSRYVYNRSLGLPPWPDDETDLEPGDQEPEQTEPQSEKTLDTI